MKVSFFHHLKHYLNPYICRKEIPTLRESTIDSLFNSFETLTFNTNIMKKKDLKPGMIITIRNGERYMVYQHPTMGDIFLGTRGYLKFSEYNDELLCVTRYIVNGREELRAEDPEFDIVSVESATESVALQELQSVLEHPNKSNLIWKRK